MRDLLAGAVSTARPGVEAVEFTELVLALTRGLEADLSDPDAPARRLRHGVALLVAGLSTLLSAPPEAVAKVIERAVTTTRPRARYVVTPAAKALVHTRRLLGARVFDAYLRMQFRDSA